MNRIPDRFVSLPNCGAPWRPRIDFLARLDYYGDPAPVNRLPTPPPVPAESREAALTVPPPRRMWHEASTWTDRVERAERLATMREYGVLADDLRALDRLYHAPDCAGCGAPDGVPCVDDECSGHADPDAYEMF